MELQKIELLQWFYANLTYDQMKRVKEIAKNIMKDEKVRHAGSLPETDRKN